MAVAESCNGALASFKFTTTWWVLVCWSRMAFWRKSLPHWPHLYGFSPVWIRICCSEWEPGLLRSERAADRPRTHLIQYRSLPEEARTVDAAVRFLVGVYSQVLRQVGLLAEALPALGARIRSRLDVYAAVLQQRRLLLELLLANRAAHVQRHAGRPAVLDDVGQQALRTLFQILQRISTAEHRMIVSLCVFEISRILEARPGTTFRGKNTLLIQTYREPNRPPGHHFRPSDSAAHSERDGRRRSGKCWLGWRGRSLSGHVLLWMINKIYNSMKMKLIWNQYVLCLNGLSNRTRGGSTWEWIAEHRECLAERMKWRQTRVKFGMVSISYRSGEWGSLGRLTGIQR